MDDYLRAYASFDAASTAFRARISSERVDFYTGATGDRFCCALAAAEVAAAPTDATFPAGPLLLHEWQVREIKARLRTLGRRRERRDRISALDG